MELDLRYLNLQLGAQDLRSGGSIPDNMPALKSRCLGTELEGGQHAVVVRGLHQEDRVVPVREGHEEPRKYREMQTVQDETRDLSESLTQGSHSQWNNLGKGLDFHI